MKKSDLEVGAEYAVKLGYGASRMVIGSYRLCHCRLVDPAVPTENPRYGDPLTHIKLEVVEDYGEQKKAGDIVLQHTARNIICPWDVYVPARAEWERERDASKAIDEETKRRHDAVFTGLAQHGIVIKERNPWQRRPNLVEMHIDEAEKLLNLLEAS